MTVPYDLVCFSHLRWRFVFQRPQHLLSRCAKSHRVFFVEEPIYGDEEKVDVSESHGVTIVVPQLLHDLTPEEHARHHQALLDNYLSNLNLNHPVLWYYTPMAISWTTRISASAVIYDCMDELSAFHGASPLLLERERQLFSMADLVYTGGQSLYEAKRPHHPNVFAFPSSVDVHHFEQAKNYDPATEPEDQRDIPHPRLGFFGVIDERFDLELLRAIADAKPDWHFVMVGPVVKIDQNTLPKSSNIHYLGGKDYSQLPSYIAGWDVALLLFARNESTRFISPTKTPEYLAAGKSVVSTSITDVVRPYGQSKLVRIADEPEEFVKACEQALLDDTSSRPQVDEFLSKMSWDKTWQRMDELIQSVLAQEPMHELLSKKGGSIVKVIAPQSTQPHRLDKTA